MLLLLTSTSTKSQGKIRGMVLMHTISQITNLKMVRDVLGLRESVISVVVKH